ncbi:MAG: fumarylacetoacetate hydrolase family protein [Bacteroidales bacterium]|jgi:2-keto-4-pentenoate hydratase/2-oxohepta-3-ene-1,7-dioic acid hydratase in catechol pathway|nr:fumarylacetoacetate hydrolase family protein [Bacteroidales bacterium]
MKIICAGRNYKGHIDECKYPIPDRPVFFLKPETSLLLKNRPFFLPDFSQDIQYELELVIRISKAGKCIQERFAHTYYNEAAVGIDFTARDLQRQCIENREPWDMAKSFDNSAVVSNFISLSVLPPVTDLTFQLLINDKEVQRGNTSEMLFSVDRLISYISQFISLKTGDLLFTGTPANVGKAVINDHFQACLEGQKLLDFKIK